MNITTEALLADIYTNTSYGVTFKNNRDGTATFRNGDHFFMLGEETEDDGALWGWTWSTGIYEADYPEGERPEYWTTDGCQVADEVLAAAIRHLGAIEDNR